MAPTPPTIVSLKQSFLTTQTRLLSQPLHPTRAWRSANSGASPDEGAGLPEKAVDDALFKLNHRLQQHARRVYAPQATRHVAEQIDQLYWNAAEAAAQRAHQGGDGGDDGDDGELAEEEALSVGADLADPSTIALLPAEWDDAAEASAHPAEARRYAELAAELHALAARKADAAARVARLRRMQALLAPFSPAEPAGGAAAAADGGDAGGAGAGVQENLITRNGEIEAELQRMRVLLARVGGRVGMLREQGGLGPGRGKRKRGEAGAEGRASERGGDGAVVEGVEVDAQRKVGQLLERF